ncbi:zinc-binding dehydrogenase [Streptomyces sp. NPDC046977]|uniref:zinc-binding dehydrogenase n=1 Tax=Streptomyces sp. NPDC046977 TaxID=3154703 RepID=UPI0033DD94BF
MPRILAHRSDTARFPRSDVLGLPALSEGCHHAAAIAHLAARGALRGKVDTTLPLADAAEAHRRGEASEIDGKLVLIP